MRLYVVDLLTEEDSVRLREEFQERGMNSALDGLFWILVPDHLLSIQQKKDYEKCGPYVVALEFVDKALHVELLVRAKASMDHASVAPVSFPLLQWLIEYLDNIFADLLIKA